MSKGSSPGPPRRDQAVSPKRPGTRVELLDELLCGGGIAVIQNTTVRGRARRSHGIPAIFTRLDR